MQSFSTFLFLIKTIIAALQNYYSGSKLLQEIYCYGCISEIDRIIPEGGTIKHLRIKVTQDLDGASCLKGSKTVYFFSHQMFYRWFQRLRNGRAKSKVNHEVICGTSSSHCSLGCPLWLLLLLLLHFGRC